MVTARTHHVTCCWRERSNLTSPREASLGTVREDATTTADSTPRRAATVLGTPSRRSGRQSTAGSRQITDGPVFCLAAPPELTDASTNIPFSLNVLTVDVFLLLQLSVTVSGCGLRLFFFLPSRNKRNSKNI